MQSIIRQRDELKGGLNLRYIFGLNIFAANGINIPVESDPRIIFLRTLSNYHACSAHTGNLYDLAENPPDLFEKPPGEDTYILASISVNGGIFYDAKTWNTFPPCFFPQVDDGFWQARMDDGRSVIVEALEYDALAIYAGINDNVLDEVVSLVKKDFPGHEAWLKQMVDLYKLVILSSGDGEYFSVYSQNDSQFDSLSPALIEAVDNIKTTEWYRQHVSSLIWDDKSNLCLMQPEMLKE